MTAYPRQLGALLAIGAVIVLAACNAIKPPPDTSTKALMPKPGGYTYIDITANQATFINAFAGGAAVTSQLEVAAAIKVIGELANCYQQAGAYEAAGYQNQGNPLQVGGVLLINNSVLSNPAVLAGCFAQRSQPNRAADQPASQPCVRRADFTYDNKSFTAFVGGSFPNVCSDLCSQFPGGAAVCKAF
jgi:hypothetical protein